MNSYLVKRAGSAPLFEADFFTGAEWKNAEILVPGHRFFNLNSAETEHFAPSVQLKMLYDDAYLYGKFRVEDRYVRVIRTGYHQDVCKDSCVEIFIQPKGNKRYYNFEFSGGGAMLLFNVTDLRGGIYAKIPEADCETILRKSSLPARVLPEIQDPVTWYFQFSIPIAFFMKYGDNVDGKLSGQTWRANVTKCADESSHPCWLSWQSLPRLDFHQPDCFGDLVFE